MSDSDFVDVGDELVVSISGYPVCKARVYHVDKYGVHVEVPADGEWEATASFILPLDFKQYDKTDGYGHHSQPLTGVAEDDSLSL